MNREHGFTKSEKLRIQFSENCVNKKSRLEVSVSLYGPNNIFVDEMKNSRKTVPHYRIQFKDQLYQNMKSEIMDFLFLKSEIMAYQLIVINKKKLTKKQLPTQDRTHQTTKTIKKRKQNNYF